MHRCARKSNRLGCPITTLLWHPAGPKQRDTTGKAQAARPLGSAKTVLHKERPWARDLSFAKLNIKGLGEDINCCA